jgi:hypothetical protein
MAAIAYSILQQAIIRSQGQGSILKEAIGHDWKGKLSPVLYLVAMLATLRSSWIGEAILVIAALMWFIPDTRIEKRLAMQKGSRSDAGGESALQDENPRKNSGANSHQR